jgi:type 2A phosphatase activator TIP41
MTTKSHQEKNWTFTSTTTPILNANELEEWSTKLEVFSMPEMIFNSNMIFKYTDSNDSNKTFELGFNAYDALEWGKRDVLQKYQVPNVKVSCAWDEKTISTSSSTLEVVSEREDNIDWTFTTMYKGTILRNGQSYASEAQEKLPNENGKLKEINYDRLKQQDEIVFYDDIMLYHDELHDHGESKLNVKARVMHHGFFALLRLFLRIDGVCVRILDTRLYHEFGSDVLVREYTWLESTWQELQQKNPILVRDPVFMSDPNRLTPMLNKKNYQLRNILLQPLDS